MPPRDYLMVLTETFPQKCLLIILIIVIMKTTNNDK